MSRTLELLQQGRKEELWQKCCGFIDLSMEQFMSIQKRLLLEQIEMLKDCSLGRKIMRGARPRTVEEFREQVPLTTYVDYCPELLERREEVLPAKPVLWVHTSGMSGEYSAKWIPLSEGFWQEVESALGAIIIFATSKKRGEVVFDDKFKLLYAVAPAPYTMGTVAYGIEDAFGFSFFPPLGESEGMPFEERLEKGFRLALSEGLEGFYGLSGVLAAIGEKFAQGSGSMKISELPPKALPRLLKGVIKSKLARRPLLPKDLWSLKGISTVGTDSVIYKERIRDMWGRSPLDMYGCSEGIALATQTWDYNGMTPFVSLNFLEFIPEEEWLNWQLDHSYQPRTVLLDEVEVGKNYELVFTNFHGGAMVRYRVGDMIRITSLRNEDLNINLPQMAFERRADDLIDLGFIRLTEKVIWQAIENTGIAYQDWIARKEIREGKPVLSLHLELKEGHNGHTGGEEGVAKAVYEQIRRLDDGFIYPDLENMIDYTPIEITLLPQGAFSNYTSQRRAEGADLAHLKPSHINPSDSTIGCLVNGVGKVAVSSKPERHPETVHSK
jgi:hypothetical protein